MAGPTAPQIAQTQSNLANMQAFNDFVYNPGEMNSTFITEKSHVRSSYIPVIFKTLLYRRVNWNPIQLVMVVCVASLDQEKSILVSVGNAISDFDHVIFRYNLVSIQYEYPVHGCL